MTITETVYREVMAEVEYASSVAFLLSQLGAHASGRFAALIGETGLTARAFGVLTNVAELGPRTQQQLADELGMHRNNMVGQIDELEAQGWVRRVRSPRDRRAYLIESTPEGRRVAMRALRVVPTLDAELTSSLTPAAARRLAAVLAELAADAGLTAGVHPHLARRRPAGG